MTLRKQGKYWVGNTQADIHTELLRYSRENAYVVHHFRDVVCDCGSRHFYLELDETVGVAIRICPDCENEHAMGDSAEYLDDADLLDQICVCEKDVFEITVGVSLYDESDDVRWIYIGCRCIECGILGCYGDWKNEYIGYETLLDQV